MASPPMASAGMPGVVTASKETGENCKCARCGGIGSDVRVEPCGCTLHARCTPLTIFADHKDYMVQNRPAHTIPMPNICCPICQRSLVMGLYLFPMSFRDLEESGALRRRCAAAASSAILANNESTNQQENLSGNVRKRGDGYDDSATADDLHQVQAEATPFLGLVHSMASDHHRGEVDRHHSRTGRWTAEEMAYADHLIRSFEGGLLPVPQGVKLNEFLSDFLMCKSSRLTKKMKNAKLSTRSYTFGDWRSGVSFCFGTLSRLQDLFLKSVPTEPVRLELNFNITRMWRVHFSNLCLQLGYETLRAEDWLASLEEMERKSIEAEEALRGARRKKMGLALRKDSMQECLEGVFICGVPGRDGASTHSTNLMGGSGPLPQATPTETLSCSVSKGGTTLHSTGPSLPVTQNDVGLSQCQLSAEGVSNNSSGVEVGPVSQFDNMGVDPYALSNLATSLHKDSIISGMPGSPGRTRAQSDDLSLSRPRLFSEDLSVALGGENDPLSGLDLTAFDPPTTKEAHNDCGPFLEQVIDYIEEMNIPFQHVDVWVPSFMPGETSVTIAVPDQQNLRLCNAGFAVRGDLASSTTAHNLHEFGLYSANFSFTPGSGMPGRVYVTGIPTWENSIQNASPDHFKRCGGAKLYGIKTVLGVPVFSSTIGRIVVALYSTEDVPRDIDLVRKCFLEFQSYHPEPSWKLVIEMSAQGRKRDTEGTNIDAVEKTTELSSSISGAATKASDSAVMPAGDASGDSAIPRINSESSTSTSSTIICHSYPNSDDSKEKTRTSMEEDPEEQQIAALLGEHMPTDPSGSLGIMPNFVSLRLLLLRSPSRRSPTERDMIGIVKKSYRGYVNMNRRSRADVATLLVKDWMFLSSSSFGNQQNIAQMHSSVSAQPPTAATTAKGMTHTQYGEIRQDNQESTSNQQMVKSSSVIYHNTQQSGSSVNGNNFMPLQSRPRSFALTSHSPISDDGTNSTGPDGLSSPRPVPRSRSVSEDPTSPRYNTKATLVPDN